MAMTLIDKTGLTNPEHLSRYLTLGVIMVAVIAIILLAYDNIGTLQRQVSVTPVSAPSSPGASYNASDITRYALFGTTPVPNNLENLPQTRLQLTLRGAFTAVDPANASAIIEGPDQKSRSFRVNGRVYGGATLHAVYADKVVLSHNGQLENLYFPSPAASLTAQTDSLENTAVQRTIVPSSQGGVSVPSHATPGLSEEERQKMIRARLQELRDRARNND